MIAALFLYLARCRSTQLYEALILPPTNHFQNGGSLASEREKGEQVCHALAHRRRPRSTHSSPPAPALRCARLLQRHTGKSVARGALLGERGVCPTAQIGRGPV